MPWTVPEAEIEFRFSPSGGPGGQHANKAHTRVEVTFSIENSPTMPIGTKRRVMGKLGPVVRVVADDERSQYRNRVLAVERLQAKVAEAAKIEKRRRATKPTQGSKRRRLASKRQRSDVKKNRQTPTTDD